MIDLLDLLESINDGWYGNVLKDIKSLKKNYLFDYPRRLKRVLDYALAYALIQNNLSFVRLLLQHGAEIARVKPNLLLNNYTQLKSTFCRKLVVLDLDETLFSLDNAFNCLFYCGKIVPFQARDYYLINAMSYQYLFEHLLLSPHKVIILTAATYERGDVINLLNKHLLPKRSPASFHQIDFYNAFNYGSKETLKGKKLMSILHFVNSRRVAEKQFKYSDILLLDDNPDHLNSVLEMGGEVVQAGVVGYLDEFVGKLALGVGENLPEYDHYSHILLSSNLIEQPAALVPLSQSVVNETSLSHSAGRYRLNK